MKGDVERKLFSYLGADKAYEAVSHDELKLEDLVSLQRSAQWGNSYFQIGVNRALAEERKFPSDTGSLFSGPALF